jgi:hypothetical protein
VNGKEIKYLGVIRFNSIPIYQPNLSSDRIRVLLGYEVLADCKLYTTSRYVEVTGSEIEIHVGNKEDLAKLIMQKQTDSVNESLFSKVKRIAGVSGPTEEAEIEE